MMQNAPENFPLEDEAAKLLREIRLLIRRAGKFFFRIPKDKDERMIHLFELTAWLALTTALILRIGRL